MFKVAIDFKNNKESYIENLKNRGFEISENSFGSIWIYNIRVVYSREKKLVIEAKSYEKKTMSSYEIALEDMTYFEIHGVN